MRFQGAVALAMATAFTACGPADGAEDGDSETRAPPSGSELARAAMAEVEDRDQGELWPGFHPTEFPVMIHSADSTFLFGHPSPPPEFEERSHGEMWVHPGRHPTVVASTVVELGDVLTATVIADPDRTVRSTAAEVAHEAFHAFQVEEYPDWGANPAALFTYPVDRVETLADRRLETRALQRALASDAPDDIRCWAEAALRIRGDRFADLPAEAADYERSIERFEGTAFYVEHHAAGRTPEDAALPDAGFPPDDLRRRAYSTGLAFALLLDRLDPAWRDAAHTDPAAFFPGDVLAEALAGGASTACELEEGEREAAIGEAREDVRTLRAQREEAVRAFEERDGWRVRVEAPSPLGLAGLDPMNVRVVGDEEVIHERMLRLESEEATIQLLDRAALTVGVGPHPVLDGVRTLLITGLEEEPGVTEGDGITRIEAEGIEIDVRQGRVSRSEGSIEIELTP